MAGLFGSRQTGTQTITQTNPAAEAQLPYLQDVFGNAQRIYKDISQSYYPDSTVAPYVQPDANLAAGYWNLIGRGNQVGQNLLPWANQGYTGALAGGMSVQNSPAYPGFQQFAQGQTAPQAQLASYGAQAAANNNTGLNALMTMSQGGNPYLARAIQGAVDPLVRNYQTATAPSIDAAATSSGRYGSGAQAGMYDTAQRNLARGIGDVTANMQNADLSRQLQAAQSGGQLYNQGLSLGMTAADAAARAQQFGLTGLQGGYQSGNAATLQALGYTPQFLQAQYSPELAQVQGGQGLWGINKDRGAYEQQLIDANKARYDWNQMLPWKDLGLYSQMVGGAVPGSETKTQPIYGNPAADALSGLTGIASIGRNLGLFGGGSGGLFGAGTALNAGNLFGAAPAIAAFNAAPAAAALPVAVAEPSAAIASIFGITPFIGSDRRLKEDDKVVGLLGDLPIHTFRYKGDKTQRIGYMADEVEKIDPGAVATMSNGYKAVDYGRATRSALNSMMG